MKISKLLENPTPSSTSDLNGGGYGGQAPRFGRDPEILEDEQIDETSAGATGTGSVGGGVATDLGMQRRGKGSIFQGVRTSKKFVNSPVTEDPLKDKSMDALSKAKDAISQKRMAELEKWEQDFKDSMAKRLKQKPSFEPVPVSQPGEKHSALKSRMSNLDMAIQKHQQVEALAQKLDKVGRLTPAMQSAIDTRMHIKLGPKDNYQTLNRKLDGAIEMLRGNLESYKIARKKPKKMREGGILEGINGNNYYDNRVGFARGPRDTERHDLDVPKKQPYLQQWALKINGVVWSKSGKTVIFNSEEAAKKAKATLLQTRPDLQIGIVTRGGLAEDEKVSGRMRMNDYYELADAIQEKLRQAIQLGDKERIQKLSKERDELDAHVKKHGMMPEGIEEAGMNRRDFIKTAGAVAAAGATNQAKTNQRQDLGNGFVTAVVEIDGVPFNVVLDTVSKSIYMLNQKSDGTPLVNKPGTFIVIRNGKLEPRMEVAPNIMNALQKAGLLDKQQGVKEGVRDLGYDAQSLIMKLRRDVEERRLQPTREAILAAARELAGDIDFAPELLVQQVLSKGMSEGKRNFKCICKTHGTMQCPVHTPKDIEFLESEGNISDTDLDDIDPVDHDANTEGDFTKNQIHTMLRVLTHLEHAIGDEEDLPEWVQMKLSQAQEMVVSVMNFMISDKEREVESNTGEEMLMREGWTDTVKKGIAGAALAGAALGAGNAQAADLGGYNTQYLQGVVSGQVARPMISVDSARQELQARANGKTQTQAPANTPSPVQQTTNQTPNLSAYDTQYLQGVASGRVPRPMVSVDAARQELQSRAGSSPQAHVISSRTGSNQPADVTSSRWGSNQPNNANVITSRGIQREGMNDNPKVVEGELSEESLLAKELASQFKLFNKANDRDLSGKPEDREIIAKEAAHVPSMVDRIENAITTKIAKEHPEVIQQYGKQIVQDTISNIAVYHRHMRDITPGNIDDMVDEIIQQLDRHLHMREDENI